MPDWIQLTPYKNIERAKVRIFDVKVVEIELSASSRRACESIFVEFTVVFDRFSSDRVVVMHWIIAWWISLIASVRGCDSSTTSALLRSSDFLISSWNLFERFTFKYQMTRSKITVDRCGPCEVVTLS